MRKIISFLVMVIMLVAGVNTLQADEYADSVISYTPGSGVSSPHNNPSKALGAPDHDGNLEGRTYVSLGDGGVLVIAFTDNSLTTSGDPEEDLWIFKIGSDVEATSIAISTDGSNWIEVGETSGATSGIDIDAYIGLGVEPGVRYSYVKITDLLERKSGSPWAGADIDAIEALESADPVITTTTTPEDTTTTTTMPDTTTTTTMPDTTTSTTISTTTTSCDPNTQTVCGDGCCLAGPQYCCNSNHYCFNDMVCCGTECCAMDIEYCDRRNMRCKSTCTISEIYGEYSEEVELLRAFRDEVLSQTPVGQEIIRLYYQWSLVIVKAMEEDEEFKEDVREMIDGVLGLIGETE